MKYPFTAEVTVESYLDGVRIDTFLERHFRNYSTFRLHRLVVAGQVRIDGVPAEAADRVRPRQVVEIRLIEPPDKLVDSRPIPVEILHEDPWMIVVNKPIGQVVHPCGYYHDTSLMNALQHHFDQQTVLPGLLRPGVIHRLDRLTSGVVIVSKEHQAHRNLSIAWQTGRVRKLYLAFVHGRIEQAKGTIEHHIGNVPGGATILMTTQPDAVEPRSARTSFEVIDRFERHSMVKVQPITGRMHQIRVHMASIGHPVVADEFYGPSGEALRNSQGKILPSPLPMWPQKERVTCHEGEDFGLFGRQALHAVELFIAHPVTGQQLHFEAPVPTDFQSARAYLKGEGPYPGVKAVDEELLGADISDYDDEGEAP